YTPDQQSMPFHIQTVKSVEVTDGLGSMPVKTTFKYTGGLFQRTPWADREFLGFRVVTATDAEGNKISTRFLQNENAVGSLNIFKGKIAETDTYDAAGTLITQSLNTYSQSSPFPNVYFPFLQQTENTTDDKTSRTNYQYDEYGNFIQENREGD